MGQASKICAMCRKEIEQAALRCPYCQSDTNYKYFIEIPNIQVNKERRPITTIVVIVLLGIIGIFSIFLSGFWVAAGILIFGGYLARVITERLGIAGADKVKTTCSGCGNNTEFRWTEGSLKVGEIADFACLKCKERTRCVIVA